MWKGRKKGNRLDMEVTLWGGGQVSKKDVQELGDEYAVFQQVKLSSVTLLP